jgi:peptidoglycan/LPS O-acetylase OafA/YrhL
VTFVLERFEKLERHSRRRLRDAEAKHQRLDIQGLRMVAVLTVFANHLFGWPRGGFVGVDVFFVISGFLITGNLLRSAEQRGNVSFTSFYWNRVRRIVPAATVVLILTYVAALLVFQPFRAHGVGIDALFAFVFMSNWWFAIKGTDYFNSDESVSPIQHFWSLSIEEQFYFVWPAVIFVIGVIVARKAWDHRHRMQLAGSVMAVIVVASLGWSVYETAAYRTWAYFNTFSRVWELGVGALLATSVAVFARIAPRYKPVLSWGGLALIAASLFLVGDTSTGFPAPWAVLPVVGAGLVIVAGVGGEPRFQQFLQNRMSTYIGDISYSLYLVHWPVIVFVGSLLDPSLERTAAIVALSFALAVASYHFVENPLRRAELRNFKGTVAPHFRERSSVRASVAALALVAVTLCAVVVRPDAYKQPAAPPTNAAAQATPIGGGTQPTAGPLTDALQKDIAEAVTAADWPQLDPSLDSVVNGSLLQSDVAQCESDAASNPAACTWGDPSAPTRIVLVGDSVALGYAASLRNIALNSGGQIQVVSEATGGGCAFTGEHVSYEPVTPECEERKQSAVDAINDIKPSIVVISNRYRDLHVVGADHDMTPTEQINSMQTIVDTFRKNAQRVVFLSPPPGYVNIKECYGNRSHKPADCIGQVSDDWKRTANAERKVAQAVNGVWIDSRPWFCSPGGFCPSFAGTTPTKRDSLHVAPPYADRIAPVMLESFTVAGIFKP